MLQFSIESKLVSLPLIIKMATATRKRSRATVVNQEAIGQASAFLQDLPVKPKESLSLREAVEQMQEFLQAALEKGYSYQDLAAILEEQGIKISVLTLKNYIPSGKRQAGKTKARRSRKSVQDESAPVEAAVSSPAVSAEDDSTIKPRRGRAKKTETAPEVVSTPEPARRGRKKAVDTAAPETAKPTRKSSTLKTAAKPATTRRRKSST